MRTVGVVTVARSDYGILRPLLRRIDGDAELQLRLYVSGAHLSPEHGNTVAEIEADEVPITARVPLLASSDDRGSVAAAIGDGVRGFASAFAASRPDVLVLLGDRFEMLAAAVAALPLAIPLAHVHGGESSEGAFDESIRHALTKLSHFHFAAAEPYARRLRQMGEEAWRIVVSGAPGVDAFREVEPLDDAELEARLGMHLNGPTLLVTYHPATLDTARVQTRAAELLSAVEGSGLAAVFTYPNADPGGRAVRALIDEYVSAHERSCAVASLGTGAYASLMRRSAAMVGNSSSGIIEAPSLKLPVVNVGIRQEGRLRAANVIDVGDDRTEILAAIRKAVSADFRAGLDGLVNPYGDGHASERIVDALKRADLGPGVLVKRFQDLDA